MLGLSWSDIDFVAKKINLSRQIVYIVKRGYYLTTLKTESSKRYISIDDYLIGELRRWQNQQAENEKLFGNRHENLAKFLKLENLNALSFRHTHATQLTENGAKPAGVSGRLGHKNLACTQNIYVHLTPKMQEDTAVIVNKIFQAKI